LLEAVASAESEESGDRLEEEASTLQAIIVKVRSRFGIVDKNEEECGGGGGWIEGYIKRKASLEGEGPIGPEEDETEPPLASPAKSPEIHRPGSGIERARSRSKSRYSYSRLDALQELLDSETRYNTQLHIMVNQVRIDVLWCIVALTYIYLHL